MKRIVLLFLSLSFCCALEAQSYGTSENSLRSSKGLSGSYGIEKMLDSRIDPASTGYRNYSDEKFEEFSKQMKDREWETEDGAWKRACELNTSSSYERYIAMYPGGDHVPEAGVRKINARIAETLSGAHSSLPGIVRVEADDESLTSTLVIENNTGYPLTVLYSGMEVRSLLIPIDGRTTIEVENGGYKLAASVPPNHIKPFAGQTEFVGGRYEMGFWVVSRR